MRRVGKYTRKNNIRSAHYGTKKYFLWFHNLKRWQKFAIIIGPIVTILILVPLITYLYFARDIANPERLMNRNNTGIILMDKNGATLYEEGRAKHQDIVPLEAISKSTKEALIASEDKNFYKHDGFSVLSTLRAVYGYILGGGGGFGGSTLTQQLAKITVLSSNRSFLRQYQAFSIAVAIENTYTKDQILEMYLNSAFFGGSAFGVNDAAESFFHKSPKDLTLAESAMIIGVLPAPNTYSPIYGDMKYAKERQATVLSRMVSNGFITQAEKDEALAQELAFAEPESPSDNSPAPHFVGMVLADLNNTYGEEKVARSGFQVKTTLDLTVQSQLQQAITANMANIRANGGSNAGAVAIDPATGAVRGLVGSYDWNDSSFGKVNIVTANRQPGSSFKPLYYAEALAEGVVTPATILEDTPTNFNGYEPKNALRNYNGDVTVRKALNWSLNIPAVKVMQRLGVDKAAAAAERMGITTIDQKKEYGLSLALGSVEAKLLDMAHAYAGFANAGSQHPLTYVEEIQSKYDESVKIDTPKSNQIISDGGAYLISDILSDNAARAGMFGGSLTVPGKRVAVKTGTTDDNRDAWTIGYTPELVVGVWVGNNDNTQMTSGGGTLAGPIWRSIMSQVLAKQSGNPFMRPSSIVERDVCYGSGKLAANAGSNTYKEVFLSSALPSFGCTATVRHQEKPQPAEPKPSEKESTTPATQEKKTPSSDTSGSENGSSSEDETNSPPVLPKPNPGEDEPEPPEKETATGGTDS